MKRRRNEPCVKYDPVSDVLYLMIREGVEEEFKEVMPGVNIEMDETGKVIGVEIVRASHLLGSVVDSLYRKRQVA